MIIHREVFASLIYKDHIQIYKKSNKMPMVNFQRTATKSSFKKKYK